MWNAREEPERMIHWSASWMLSEIEGTVHTVLHCTVPHCTYCTYLCKLPYCTYTYALCLYATISFPSWNPGPFPFSKHLQFLGTSSLWPTHACQREHRKKIHPHPVITSDSHVNVPIPGFGGCRWGTRKEQARSKKTTAKTTQWLVLRISKPNSVIFPSRLA